MGMWTVELPRDMAVGAEGPESEQEEIPDRLGRTIYGQNKATTPLLSNSFKMALVHLTLMK